MKKIYILFLAVAFCTACSNDDLNVDQTLLGMGGDTWAKTALDQWLYDEFTRPYNLDVKYKWDPYEVDLSKILVPINENKVKDVMTAIKSVWITPYETVAGPTFIKRLAPKSYVLVGSPEYNIASGTQTLGFAEGGKKIVLLNLNTFDLTSPAIVKRVLKTVEHEFAHTLHQITLFPDEFKTITEDSYLGGGWNNFTDAAAQTFGYVTAYARANPDEDFAETVAYILMNGQRAFDSYVTAAGVISSTAATALRAKERIIIDYFRQVWNIRFYESYEGAGDGLVEITQAAIKTITGS